MSTIFGAVKARLMSDETVFGYVADRIAPAGEVPQGTAHPYIAYQQVSSSGHDYSHGGHDGKEDQVYQYDIVSNGYSRAKQIASAVKDRLSGFSGTINGLCIDGIFLENERDVFGDDLELGRVMLDFRMVYTPSA